MSKKISVTHLGVGSVAKLVGIVQAALAVPAGVIVAGTVMVNIMANHSYSTLSSVLLSIAGFVAGVVVLPLFAFVVGWLYGAIIALVWNLVLGVSGGIEVTTEDVKE